MSSNKNILFISHDATRTGAPILLLNLADLLLSHKYNIDFILKRGGELEQEFKKRGNVFIAGKNSLTLKQRVLGRFNKSYPFTLKGINFSSYDIIVSNTITNGDILSQVRKQYQGLIVSYIHELRMASAYFSTKENIQNLIATTDLFAVPSSAVEDYLVQEYAVSKEKIFPLNYYIANKTVLYEANKKNNLFIVGGIGTSDWRKGIDLFLQTALITFKKNPLAEIEFIWKGVSENSVELNRLNYDVEKSGLTGKLKFRASSGAVDSFYNDINLLFLSSREDPFPLVVLEAANYEVPSLCFEGSGGACEFIQKSKGGETIGYLNLNAAAETILKYYNNRSELNIYGKKAKEYLQLNYQNESFIINQFNTLINALN